MQIDEDVFVEALVTQLSVETFDVRVLDRLSRLNESQPYVVLVCPGIHRSADEFRAVIDGDDFRQPTGGSESIQNSSNAQPWQGMIDLHCGAFSGHVVHDSQDPEPSSVPQTVGDEIHRPVLIRLLRTVKHDPKVADAFLSLLAAQRQAFLTIKPFDALMVHQMTFANEQNMKSRRTEFSPLLCQFSEPDA